MRKYSTKQATGAQKIETLGGDYADGYEWYALVTDLDMDARDVLPLYRERGDPDWSEAEIAEGRENVFHRRPDDHAARLKRPSAILTNVSASQLQLTGKDVIAFNCDF